MTTTQKTPPVTQVAGMTYFRREDRIHVFRFSNSRRETADAWSAQSQLNDMNAVAYNEHLQALIDIRGIWLTPYIISTVIKTVNLTPPNVYESTAVLVADNLMLGFVVGLLRKLPSATRGSSSLFISEADAIAWLHEREANRRA